VLQGNIDEEDKVDMLASDDDLNDLDLQLLALAKERALGCTTLRCSGAPEACEPLQDGMDVSAWLCQ
jgi:hypothetical protein